MSFTQKIDVLELFIELLREHEIKMDTLIKKMEILSQTKKHDPKLNKKLNEFDPSTIVESEPQCILVVDDDENLANTFKMILESAGYIVNIASTGLQALHKIKKKTYDLVLLDLNLPDMLGNLVAEEIKEENKDTDIIFITGFSMLKEDVEKHLENEEVLMKPIEATLLVEITTKTIKN